MSDINRARVLRVRSIMRSGKSRAKVEGSIEADESLEQLITLADGHTDGVFAVTRDGETVGHLPMQDVYKALVRYDLKSGISSR